MTPEGIVKEQVKSYLASIGCIPASQANRVTIAHRGYYYIPVSNGMGVHGIPDFIGHYLGRFFAIETKKPGGTPTALQVMQLTAIEMSGGKVFVIDGDLTELKKWVERG